MYKTQGPLANLNSTPWAKPIQTRLKEIEKSDSKKIIAYFYNKDYDNSTFRYRCYNMCETINNGTSNHGLSSTWFVRQDADYLLSIIHKVDTLVVCRSTMDSLLSHVISLARVFDVKLIFDIDDLVIDPQMIPTIVNTVTTIPRDSEQEESLWNYWYSYVSRLRATFDACDSAIVPTVPLADFFLNSFEKKTAVIPNFMDLAQIDYSQALFETKLQRNFERNESFTLGYFSGSPSHNKDFAIASSAIIDFMKKHKEVELLVGGYIDIDVFSRNNLSSRVSKLPYTDHLELQRNISSVEVNLAPLQQNQFTFSKSVLKYFDAAAVGVPTIASPTPNMEQAIENGRNGFISGDDMWLSTLETLFENFSETNMGLSVNANADAMINYTGKCHEEDIVKFFSK